MNDATRIPVIVGVGQVNDRTDDPFAALDPVALMIAALRAADADAGGGWLARLASLAVVDQISFRDLNPVVDRVAEGAGAVPAHRFQTAMPMGDSPVRLLNEAADRIAGGDDIVAAVVGAEALRTAARRAAALAGDTPADHNAMRTRHRSRAPGYRQLYGLTAPVDVYPLYENATRAAWGQTLAEGQAESAQVWSLFSQVAASEPGAWIRTPRTPEEIATSSDDNRPIAFPYTKLMVANSSVNQGAGFIVASLAAARAAGLSDDRLVFVGQGAAAHESDDVLARDRFDRSAGMQVSLEETLRANALTIDDIDLIELYSCFPCVPKMARRIVGWPADRPASVFGGLTFGGGPIGNYMSHAVAAMVTRLRGDGRHGLLFGNGGFATHNHSIVLSRDPAIAVAARIPFDRQAMADARREPAPAIEPDFEGPATIETYTILYDRAGAVRHGVIVARTPAGCRLLAEVPPDDAASIRLLSAGAVDLIGAAGVIASGDDQRSRWRFA